MKEKTPLIILLMIFNIVLFVVSIGFFITSSERMTQIETAVIELKAQDENIRADIVKHTLTIQGEDVFIENRFYVAEKED